MAGGGKGIPGDVEPAVAGEELIGELTGFEEIDQTLELCWVLGADVGGLAKEMLGVVDTADFAVYRFATETGIDYDRADDETGRLQKLMTAISHIDHILHRRDVLRVLAQMEEFAQSEMR
jgi:hypothetical protein